ncbi:MAG TPA: prepilin peptidase [Candidatus Copromonas faecavium]|uniref:Prepilin peptidase n=1 Tax=Candidatus Copromonas faecavium (nom. illeg.) TaxID=2840740 RepID=A0A9D1D5X1_9FIRM|nr:prepilin peptidase [Candidatus Copromonas faecavium]
MRQMVFLVVLCAASVSDLWRRGLTGNFLIWMVIAGMIFSAWMKRSPGEICCAACPGLALLLLSYVTGGKIGEGDGWFFIVSALFLTLRECLLILLSGMFFCSIFSLGFAVFGIMNRKRIGGKKFPFLPFLLPAGLWLALWQM